MAFHDVSLPPDFQYGSQFGTGFATVVQQTASGHEYRIARQSSPRHRFRLRKMLQDDDEIATLKTFILARRGALHAFRLKDWSDYTTNENGVGAVTNLDATLGAGDGSNQAFQLVKSYNEGGAGEYDRVITLPVAGTLTVALNGSPTSAYTVTNPGGVITFNTAPGAGVVVTAGFEFDVPARFDISIDDYAALQADSFQVWSMPSLDCLEVLNEVEYPELWYPGGATDWGSVTGDISLSLAQGSLHLVTNATGSTTNAFLPAPPTLFPGGPEVFTIQVDSSSTASVQVRDDSGNTVGSAITAGNIKRIGCFIDSAGDANWILW